MILRNKKTGEIIDVKDALTDSDDCPNHYVINDDWEDAPEEPKEYYYIDCYGTLIRALDDGDEWDECRKEIGNRFETKEEAEKAVERLRAWKRLKDKGFSFKRWTIPEEPKTPHIKLVIEAEMDVPESPYDLDLLFSEGEE